MGSDQQMQKLDETELRKADRTVGVNRLGMFTTEKRRYNLNNQDESL